MSFFSSPVFALARKEVFSLKKNRAQKLDYDVISFEELWKMRGEFAEDFSNAQGVSRAWNCYF